MAKERWIVHADMDAFYASVEQRDFPELRGKPVIVGGETARGVVAAASYEARAYGVHSAMPSFQARRLCPQGVFRRGRMQAYADVSGEVRRVFESFTPDVEPLALDEAFLDVSGSIGLFGGPLAIALALKEQVLEETELAVSVGVAENKLLAKIACSLSKPDGLRVVRPGEGRELLAPLELRRLWGVGPVMLKRLGALGLSTIGELAVADARRLIAEFGERAVELQARARGEDESPVQTERQAKSVGEERTFDTDIQGAERSKPWLRQHAEAVAHRLRASRLVCETVSIKIKLARRRSGATPARLYPVLTRSASLSATDDGLEIGRVACELWDRAAVAEPVRLLGVTASKLRAPGAQQLELLDASLSGTPTQARRLGQVMDQIQDRFGRTSIGRGGTPEEPD